MVDSANIDLILENTFDAYMYEERERRGQNNN